MTINGRMPLRRARLFAVGAIAMALCLVIGLKAGSAQASDAQANPQAAGDIVGIDLSPAPAEVPAAEDFPFLDGKMTPDPALLDAFARQYASETANPSIREFFLWWLPNDLFDIAYGVASPPPGTELNLNTDAGLKRALWLTHVTGWELGIFARFVLGGGLGDVPVTNAILTSKLTYMDQARQAASDTPADVLAFNLASLRIGEDGNAPCCVLQSEAGWYGYDAQFLKEISTTNLAPGVAPLPNWINYTSGQLNATYQIGDAPFLSHAREQYDD